MNSKKKINLMQRAEISDLVNRKDENAPAAICLRKIPDVITY